MVNVCICARYQSDPKESYLLAVKKIFKYLSGTLNIGLWYDRLSSLELIGYSDADFAGYKLDRKSTSDTYQFFEVNLISWFSKKQHLVAISTVEVEYITAGSCCAQIL